MCKHICTFCAHRHWLTMSKRCTSLEAKLTIFPIDSSPIVFRFSSKVFLYRAPVVTILASIPKW